MSVVRRLLMACKPHLFLFSQINPRRRWVCVGEGRIAYGNSPFSAYQKWLRGNYS